MLVYHDFFAYLHPAAENSLRGDCFAYRHYAVTGEVKTFLNKKYLSRIRVLLYILRPEVFSIRCSSINPSRSSANWRIVKGIVPLGVFPWPRVSIA